MEYFQPLFSPMSDIAPCPSPPPLRKMYLCPGCLDAFTLSALPLFTTLSAPEPMNDQSVPILDCGLPWRPSQRSRKLAPVAESERIWHTCLRSEPQASPTAHRAPSYGLDRVATSSMK